jgi:hypothetical protein
MSNNNLYDFGDAQNSTSGSRVKVNERVINNYKNEYIL